MISRALQPASARRRHAPRAGLGRDASRQARVLRRVDDPGREGLLRPRHARARRHQVQVLVPDPGEEASEVVVERRKCLVRDRADRPQRVLRLKPARRVDVAEEKSRSFVRTAHRTTRSSQEATRWNHAATSMEIAFFSSLPEAAGAPVLHRFGFPAEDGRHSVDRLLLHAPIIFRRMPYFTLGCAPVASPRIASGAALPRAGRGTRSHPACRPDDRFVTSAGFCDTPLERAHLTHEPGPPHARRLLLR